MANHQRIADLFLAFANEGSPELSAKWGLKWCEVPEEHACDKNIFAHLATYLVKTYFITDKAGKPTEAQLSTARASRPSSMGCCRRTRSASRSRRAQRPRCALPCPQPATLTIPNTACLAPLFQLTSSARPAVRRTSSTTCPG